MAATLIVSAHPEPGSFTHEWARVSIRAAEASGDRVLVSDLYAMGFDPAERGALYPGPEAGPPFDALKAQESAARKGRLPPDVASEVAKVASP